MVWLPPSEDLELEKVNQLFFEQIKKLSHRAVQHHLRIIRCEYDN